MSQVIAQFKAPYAALVVLMLTATAVYLMAEGSVDSTGFKVAAVLIGGLMTRAAFAVALRALNTCVLMVSCSLGLLVSAIVLLSAETFKDQAIEGVAVGAVTAALMVVGELLERHKV